MPTGADTHLVQWETLDFLKTYTLKASNGKFVCFKGGNDNRLYANKSEKDNTTEFTVHRLGYDTIALQTGTGKYVKVDDNDEVKLAKIEKLGEWESFSIHPVEIAIQAANGKYVYVDTTPRDEIMVIAGKDEIDKHTIFVLTKTGDSTYKVMDKHTERYLEAQQLENLKILTKTKDLLPLANFTLIRMGFNRWAIRTKKGFYINLNTDNNTLTTGPRRVKDTEIFTIVFLKVALRTHNGRFLRKVFMRRTFTSDKLNQKRSLFEIRDGNDEYFM